MRTNGFISYIIQSDEGGVDEHGVPVESGEDVWSDPVPCSIQPTTNGKGVYENGEFSAISYTILCERFPLDATRVKLQLNGIDIGERQVLGKPIKTTMDRIKIYV